jgi:hypothetical protein
MRRDRAIGDRWGLDMRWQDSKVGEQADGDDMIGE